MKVINLKLKKTLIDMLKLQKSKSLPFDLADSKLWYITNTQAKQYAAVFDSYYTTSMISSEYALLEKNMDELLSHLPNEFEFLSLGPGMAEKDELILKIALQKGMNPTYSAIDIQELFLEKTNERLDKFDIEKNFYGGDFVDDLPFFLSLIDKKPLFVYLGATYSNYNSQFILSHLHKNIRTNDLLYLSMQQITDLDKTLQSYGAAKDLMVENISHLGIEASTNIYFNTDSYAIEARSIVKTVPNYLDGILNEGDELILARSIKLPFDRFNRSISPYFQGTYFKQSDFNGFIGKKK